MFNIWNINKVNTEPSSTRCGSVGLKMTSAGDQWGASSDWALLSLVAHVTGLCKYCSESRFKSENWFDSVIVVALSLFRNKRLVTALTVTLRRLSFTQHSHVDYWNFIYYQYLTLHWTIFHYFTNQTTNNKYPVRQSPNLIPYVPFC